MSGANLIAVSIGNSRTQVGHFADGELHQSAGHGNRQPAAIVQRILRWWEAIKNTPAAVIVVASVNARVSDRIRSMLKDQLSIEIYQIGDDIPVPISCSLDPETITGVDRLLNAVAAFEHLQQACVVVDAGTALTVDFVDGEGNFFGGAILPGARMQLHALHTLTAALPEIDLAEPDEDPFGRSTSQAMLNGVVHGIRGAVQRLVERYAMNYNAFPQVIATGGDAKMLFADDDLIDHVVSDLTLIGIGAAARHALASDEVDGL